jgi:hypothetical protein
MKKLLSALMIFWMAGITPGPRFKQRNCKLQFPALQTFAGEYENAE